MPVDAVPPSTQPPNAVSAAVRVNLTDDAKRAYWVACLGVTEERLRQVVAEVGPVAKDVRLHLGQA
jgi:uncharacterized protein DUF3606